MGDAPTPKRRQRAGRAAVRADSDERLIAFVRGLRRRLPGDERFGDPLSLAGDDPVALVARQATALSPSRPSALQEFGLGALQLWQSASERAGRGRGTEELAILFTDLVGFSSWALQAGDEPAVELLRQVGCAIEDAVADHDGRIVKRLGDGAMAVFPAVPGAADAALASLEALEGIEVAGHRPRMRAGVHSGHPRKLGGDYLGVDVNIAARVAEAASGGQLLVSEPACEALPDAFELGRAKRLKAPGAPRDLRVRPCTKGPRPHAP